MVSSPSTGIVAEKEAVRVVVRCRPFNEKESQEGHSNIISLDEKGGTVTIFDPSSSPSKSESNEQLNKNGGRTFTFDSAFGEQSLQESVFDVAAKPIVDCVLSGYNGTIFAYGQTGTGKTFSMEGNREVDPLKGIIPRSIEHIFDHIKKHASSNVKFLVRASFLEIYNEDIYDLLAAKSVSSSSANGVKLELKERPDIGVFVKDLSTFVVKSVPELEKLMAIGNRNRSVGATLMNARSSRSHSIFTITVEMSEEDESGSSEQHIRVGKLHLVDLAGSERQAKTGATGDRLKEATKINLSLSALGNVISALVDGKSTHIPYRDSKLTRLLQDSLGGNSKTLMIATLSPASYNYEETMSTLRYANRAKSIKNKPKVNEDPKDALLREFQEQIKRLREQLEMAETGDTAQTTVEEEAKLSGSEATGKKVKGSREKAPVSGSQKSLKKGSSQEEIANAAHEQVEKERQALLSATEMIQEERDRLLAELDQRDADIEREREEREQLARQLQEMEDKLLVGGVNLLHKTEEQEAALAAKVKELEQRRQKEMELAKALQMKQEAQLQIEENFSSLQEEAMMKSRKLKQLSTFWAQQRAELRDTKREISTEREELLETIRSLTTELKLKNKILNAFIPDDALAVIEEHSEYDAANERWRIAFLNRAGNNVARESPSALKNKGVAPSSRAYNATPSSRSVNRPGTNTDSMQDWMGFSAHPLWDTQHVFLSYQDMVPKAYEAIILNNGESEDDSLLADGQGDSLKGDGRNVRSVSLGSSKSRTQSGKRDSLASAGAAKKNAVESTPSARGLVTRAKRYA